MKPYIKPTCKCYDIELQKMIAGSYERIEYGGSTSTAGVTEASSDERHHWGSLWNE